MQWFVHVGDGSWYVQNAVSRERLGQNFDDLDEAFERAALLNLATDSVTLSNVGEGKPSPVPRAAAGQDGGATYRAPGRELSPHGDTSSSDVSPDRPLSRPLPSYGRHALESRA